MGDKLKGFSGSGGLIRAENDRWEIQSEDGSRVEYAPHKYDIHGHSGQLEQNAKLYATAYDMALLLQSIRDFPLSLATVDQVYYWQHKAREILSVFTEQPAD